MPVISRRSSDRAFLEPKVRALQILEETTTSGTPGQSSRIYLPNSPAFKKPDFFNKSGFWECPG
ncbi:MAG: hypothetical protein F6K47_42075 [Symploca sp. SIO2E6]|nr:hypothetical protein [Symploca sp. SIO2E6]